MLFRVLRATIITTFIVLIQTSIFAQPPSPSSSFLRIGHFSPDGGPVDIYVNGELAFEDFAFPELTDWQVFEQENVEITITAPDVPIEDRLLEPVIVNLQPGKWYTTSVIGEFTRETGRIHTFEENFSPIDEGETRITVYNTSPDAQPLSLYGNDNLLIGGLAYPGSQGDNDGAANVDVVAGSYDLRLTEVNSPETAIFRANDTVLGRDRHYLIVGIGLSNNLDSIFVTTNVAEILPNDGENQLDSEGIDVGEGNTRVRVGHFGSDMEALDLYLNGIATDLTDIAYVGLSDWISIPAGVYEIAFAPASTDIDSAIVGPFDAALVANEWYTLAVVGFAEDNSLIARVVRENYMPIARGESRLTFFNAVPDLPAADIVINDQVFVGALSFPGRLPTDEDGAADVDVAANNLLDIEVTAVGDLNESYVQLFDTRLAPGNHYFIAAVNTLDTIDYYLQVITQDAVIQNVGNE